MTFPVVPREQCRFVFTIDGVYKHSGTHLEEPIQRLARVYVPQLAAEANREPQPQTFGFAIWWEKTRPYLKLWLECINDRGARSDLGKNQRVADYLTPNLPTEFECCAGLLREDWQLILHVEVNTDDPAFLKLQLAEDAGGMIVPLRASVVLPNQVPQAYWIGLSLEPVADLPAYGGAVALDLGNTCTTLVYGEPGATANIEPQLLRFSVEVAPPGGPLPSAVRILSRKAGPPDRFPKCECLIGRKSFVPAAGGALVLGAKRLLSDDASVDQPTTLNLDSRSIEVPHREPAEVFVGQIFRAFYNSLRSYPRDIVLTCPTTFSSWEVQQLRAAVYQAWRESRGESKQEETDAEFKSGLKGFVTQVIDEASAAAFYFLYRDFFTGAGRLPIFRYLYPQGMHLLLYDCGGGTTDISLVRAVAASDNRVKIDVLGRAGHREFGGDTITKAVFAILKAKIAAVRRGPAFPDGSIKAHLEQEATAIDRLVPTRFGVNDYNEEAKKRRNLTLLLWRLAEAIKCTLSGRPDGADPLPLRDLPPSDLDGLKTLLQLGDQEYTALVGKVTIAASEINELIDPEIYETIRYANQLIRRGIRSPEGDSETGAVESALEVDAVYVVGNASLYPRFRQLLIDKERGLRVRFIQDRLRPVAPQDLKNSVAKGAILALHSSRFREGFAIDFDETLIERLPYTITYHTLGSPNDVPLFHEHRRYDELTTPIPIVVAPPNAGQEPQRSQGSAVGLQRLWPGDVMPSRYLTFRFERPISGNMRVYYKKDKSRFVMEDALGPPGQQPVEGRPPVVEPYRAPPESGQL